jgi:hypothetical protein
MKINLLKIVLLVFSFNATAQTTIQWTDSIEVVNTAASITAPRITLLADGTPLVMWGESGNGIASKIYCSRLEGGVFSAPASVIQSIPDPQLFGFGGYDVAVSDNQVFVVFERSQQGVFLAKSSDGGLTFNTPVVVQGPEPDSYATLSSVVVDGTGNPVVSYIMEQNGGANYRVRRSADGGSAFDGPVIANTPAPGGGVCECCTSDMIASGDSLWLLFRNNNQNIRDIWVSRSTDLSATFDTATDLDATDWQINACPISGPRMARSGDTLLAVWMSGASGTGHVYLNSLHMGTMQAGQQIDFSTGTGLLSVQSTPDITALGDTVGIVYVKKAKEIAFHFSTKGTAGLIDQNMVFAQTGHVFRYPSLAFRDGVFHLVYVDATEGAMIYRQGKLVQTSPTREPVSSKNILIYPNPAAGFLTIQTKNRPMTTFTLTDIQGKTVYSSSATEPLGNPVSIDLKNCIPGVYFIHYEMPEGDGWEKIIKND